MKPTVKAEISKYAKEEILPLAGSAAFLIGTGIFMSFAAWGATHIPTPYDLLPRRLISENFVPATLVLSTVASALCGGVAFLSACRAKPIGWKRKALFWVSAKITDFSFGIGSLCYGLIIAAFIKKSFWGIDAAGVPASLAEVQLFLAVPLYLAYFFKAPAASVGMGKFCAIMGVFCIGLTAALYWAGSQGAADAAKKQADQHRAATGLSDSGPRI